jgi:hypothetical protein
MDRLPLSLIGNAVAVLALAAVLYLAWLTWRRPFLGLGVLVAGMAFHNFAIMVLLRLGTSHVLVRAVQLWKEGILALLVVIAAMRLLKAYRERRLGRPLVLDWVAGAFLLIMFVYLLLPSGLFHNDVGLQARLAAFRLAALIPVLYALGRTFQRPSDDELAVAVWMVVGAAAIVGAFGLIELWLVPTRTWLDWGVNGFSAWLGFQYQGPGGLPENFFQTLSPYAYLRRMVSTYISPLGIAYTGLLVFPMAVVLLDRQPAGKRRVVAATALILVVVGILFCVTRLAMFLLVGEAALMALLLRRRWTYVLLPLTGVAVAATIVYYPVVGPVVEQNLNPISVHGGGSINTGGILTGGILTGGILRAGDPSFAEHLRTVLADLQVAVTHPLGQGLGSSGSPALRFGPTTSKGVALGESAVLTTFVDTGVLGGVAYLALFGLGLLLAARRVLATPRGSLAFALPVAAAVGGLALIPITLTSDVWGDLSVTFLLWWAIGYSASLVAGSFRLTPRSPALSPQGERE